MTAKEVLKKAAEILRKDGWWQGKMHYGGSHCVVGAIDSACEKDAVMRLKCILLVKDAAGILRAGRIGLANWNDDPKRTFEQVLAALDEAALKETA